jgi:diguanylate cyclase (GGDEF)-like protein/putative nucleotidyltransferase with HDIG domain
LNTWLITLAIASERQVNPLQLWISKFLWLSLNYFFGASVAVLVVSYNRTLDVGFIGVIVPLLLVLYFTFRSTIARVDDADRHVEELNALYLSTIETLAMAIDAKDQVTHGHIRRVQNYAVGLARFVGVSDKGQIRAIEAAALLHDMGKLAVPEYILNKPGKLTPAEFEKMKLHATVGADLLSEIAFPYPVVPIVRYHHEAWDGSGYPHGLKGTEIPIGARILAVVDCFDALTSDRPYRPRLSDDEAITILLERRGSMYDPLIVDTFVKVHNTIDPEPLTATAKHRALVGIHESAQDPITLPSAPSLDEITASGDEMLTLYEIAGALGGQASIADTGEAIAKHLRRLVPFSLLVLYVYDQATDDLEARHAVGDAAPVVKGTRISIGQRLSGWVGANRQTIMNSDPVLDLGEMARAMTPRLRNCLSAPLILNGELVGVLTLYSAGRENFTDDHRRIIEVVANQAAQTFKREVEAEVPVGRDLLTLLPHFSQLEQLAGDRGQSDTLDDALLTLMIIDVVALERINIEYGRAAGDEVLRHVARFIRSEVHLPDILFRYRSDEFIALLHSKDARAMEALGRRVTDTIRDNHLVLRTGAIIPIEVAVSCVSAPQNGHSLRDLLAAARASVPSHIEASPGSTVH